MAVQFTEETTTEVEKVEVDNDGTNGIPPQRDKIRPPLAQPAAEMNVGYNASNVALLVKVFLFLDGCTHNGLTHLVNVYLVAIIGWTPLDAAWIWFTRDVVKFLSQASAGSLADKTEYKKSILSVVAVLKIISGVIMVRRSCYDYYGRPVCLCIESS